MSNKAEYILCIQLPNQPQTTLGYESKEAAKAAVCEGIEKGVIESDGDMALIVVNVCPGAVYIIVSKENFERQVRQAQLMQMPKGRV